MLDPFGEFTEAWVQIEGIPPKWCAWKIFAQVVACFGILVDVDWNGMFKSFYEVVRIKVACRDPKKNPFERLVEMKRKLYILFFTVKGFDQIGEESDGDDVDPDGDSHENPDNGTGRKGVQGDVVSAAHFHPHILVDVMHEEFIEETKEKLPEEGMAYLETGMEKDPEVNTGSPTGDSVVPMSVHLDYCSEQLRKFDMMESDEDEEEMMPEMQCLTREVSIVLGSTKRSLLDTLEREAGQKKKINATNDGRWGAVLNNKPRTREHGRIKIMDKALAYMQKKNLEIPATFKGKSFANLTPETLISYTNMVDICIGKNEMEQLDIVSDMVNEERIKSI
ncbi:hypothetical protein D1007_55385 [Hordeum vulgare]|nr:hypothetical protein D1007_55385 [Hordeum vulgare]